MARGGGSRSSKHYEHVAHPAHRRRGRAGALDRTLRRLAFLQQRFGLFVCTIVETGMKKEK